MNSRLSALAALLLAQICLQASAAEPNSAADVQWQPLESMDGSTLTARHEAAGVVVGEAIYLIGGRGNRPVERYSVFDAQWDNLGLAPVELHHVQPVVLGTDILLLGAFTCCYPDEALVAEIHVFDTLTETWSVQGSLPADRLRGSAAAVTYQGRIYLLGGNTLGHNGGAVAWFDEYDPVTGEWRVLPDAPNARDHFSAVMIGTQLLAAAGRQTSLPNPSANAVQAVDIYDFESGAWRSATTIPTVRGGAVSVAHGSELIVAGGEINTSDVALDIVEAYDVETDQWRTLSAMTTGRHGSGGGIIDDRLLMLSGASRIGGSHETGDAEFLHLPEVVEAVDVVEPPDPVTPVEPQDGDGEKDESEVTQSPSTSSSGGGASGALLLLALLGLRLRRSVASGH